MASAAATRPGANGGVVCCQPALRKHRIIVDRSSPRPPERGSPPSPAHASPQPPAAVRGPERGSPPSPAAHASPQPPAAVRGPFQDVVKAAFNQAAQVAQNALAQEHEHLLRLRESQIRRELQHELVCGPQPQSDENDLREQPCQPWLPEVAEAGTQTRVDYTLSPLYHLDPRLFDHHGPPESLGQSHKCDCQDQASEASSERKYTAQKKDQDLKSKLVKILGGTKADDEMNADDFATRRSSRLLRSVLAQFSTKHGKALLVDQLMGVIIILNTALIGISCDVAIGWGGWLVIDFAFATLFLAEIIFKIWLWGAKDVYCGAEWRWGWLESLLVFTAWFELVLGMINWADSEGSLNISLFRVVRLVRITRIIRVLRLQFMGDLLLMIRGAMGGLRTLGWSMVLISVPVYAVALVLRETLGNTADPGEGGAHFTTLGDAFFTVFRCTVAGDCTQKDGKPIFVLATADHGWAYGLVYILTLTFMMFGLFNVIIAIYVENTVAAAKYNEIFQKRQRLRDQQMLGDKAASLVRLVWRLYQEGVGGVPNYRRMSEFLPPNPSALQISERAAMIQITPAFLEELRKNPRFQEILQELDVSDEDQLDLFDTLDVDGGGSIDLDELITGIAKLRGDARRADIVAVGLVLRNVQAALQHFEVSVNSALANQGATIRDMMSSPLLRATTRHPERKAMAKSD